MKREGRLSAGYLGPEREYRRGSYGRLRGAVKEFVEHDDGQYVIEVEQGRFAEVVGHETAQTAKNLAERDFRAQKTARQEADLVQMIKGVDFSGLD